MTRYHFDKCKSIKITEQHYVLNNVMEHPFINTAALADKSMEDLQNSINDLTKKLNFAYQMQNGAMINQLRMVMESYKAEYGRKMDEVLKKQGDRTQINIQKES